MFTKITVLIASVLLAVYANGATQAEEPVTLRVEKVRTIELRVPESWRRGASASEFRAAQFAIPTHASGRENAELVVYYFGNAAGGVQANLERWVGQFQEEGRTVERFQGKSEQGRYFLADIAGTWKQPIGPPMARKTVDKPGSRVMGLILLTDKESDRGYYFLKLAGPDAFVKSLGGALRVAIGADVKAEEPYDMKTDKIVHTEKEWRELLSPEQYRVLRLKGTERPFRNKFDEHFEPGTYSCAACGQELFSSDTKFNSGCGWPAFYAARAGDRVTLTPDYSLNMIRMEVCCARCGSHLGHVFNDAPQTPTGHRFCINSISLKFTPAKVVERKERAKAERERKEPG